MGIFVTPQEEKPYISNWILYLILALKKVVLEPFEDIDAGFKDFKAGWCQTSGIRIKFIFWCARFAMWKR